MLVSKVVAKTDEEWRQCKIFNSLILAFYNKYYSMIFIVTNLRVHLINKAKETKCQSNYQTTNILYKKYTNFHLFVSLYVNSSENLLAMDSFN